ncbi:MAG: penicillin acylase family protein [Candidatus Hydrogenedentes bacterium]|nr:penicillin acylase family protein [Candidatus Hydrogenedentota bacterium]
MSALLNFASAQVSNDPSVLWTQATLYRDEWGTPHVYGDNPRALAFAFGWAQAEDHLQAMLLAYRIANGRAAEVLGETYAASDEFALKMEHAALAQEAFPGADAITRDLCEGFAIGVNAWLVAHPAHVPPWAEGVQPADILALLHCYLMSFAPFDLAETYHLPAAAVTGNAWAIGPQRSETGEPILVINPHTYYNGPFQWYEAHLVCQDVNVMGATLFGLPVILQGHNEALGWALSPNEPDFADVYMELPLRSGRNPKSANFRRFEEETLLYLHTLTYTKPYYVATASGPVRRAVTCMRTTRGPVIGKFRGQSCSYRIGGYGEFGAVLQLFEMARARTLQAFQGALVAQQLPCFHIVYADREGNIFYLYNAKVGMKSTTAGAIQPIEGAQAGDRRIPVLADWLAPIPADNPLYAWGALVPAGDLPSLLNPPCGYIQACGTPPWAAADDSRLKPELYPNWLVLDRDTYRAQRTRHLLKVGKRTFRDAQSMLYDVLVPFAMEAVPTLLGTAQLRPDLVAQAHPDLPAALQLLRNWNYVAETNSPGMTFFHVWWASLFMQARPLFRSEGDLYDALRRNPPEMQELTLRAASEAAKVMRNEFQSLAVPWGDVHMLRRGEREVPMPGAISGEPIFVSSDRNFANRQWPVTYGYGYAMVVKFGAATESVSMLPFGISEDPTSPHYADQMDLMVERRFKRTHFQHEVVQRHAEVAFGKVLHLVPVGSEGVVTIQAATPVEARLNLTTDSPVPLPDGLVPFTVYITPDHAPQDVPIEVELDLAIPTVACPPERLGELALYGYDAATNWNRLAPQQLIPETRTISARDSAPRTYAVLGPPTAKSILVAQDAEPVVSKATKESGPVVAPITPPSVEADHVSSPPLVEAAPELAQAVEPPIPEDTEPVANDPAITLSEPKPASEEPTPLPAAEPPSSATEPVAPVSNEERKLARKREREEIQKRMLQPRTASTEKVLELPTPVAVTDSVWSDVIELRPPGMEGLFVITAKSAIGARLLVFDKPALPLPEGLAAFTPYLGVELSTPRGIADIAMTLKVREDVCAPENLEELHIYAASSKQGWTALAGANLNASQRALSGFDDRARIYTVLGPAECRLRDPALSLHKAAASAWPSNNE